MRMKCLSRPTVNSAPLPQWRPWIAVLALGIFAACGAHSVLPVSSQGASLARQASGTTLEILHRFRGDTDGQLPIAGITIVNGAFYGATSNTIYELQQRGAGFTEKVLHDLSDTTDGSDVWNNLVYHDGSLFGVAIDGGPKSKGTFFKFGLGGSGFQRLFSFDGDPPDGGSPWGPALIGDSFYVSDEGCYSCAYANVVRFSPVKGGYKESLVHELSEVVGWDPQDSLAPSPSGRLFGTSTSGGGSRLCQGGCGSVFEAPSSGATPKRLHEFGTFGQGRFPEGSVWRDKKGDLFGTTAEGGSNACTGGCGTVFELALTGGKYAFKSLYAFKGPVDGYFPLGTLIGDEEGHIYGTTADGGNGNAGTIFELSSANGHWSEQKMFDFQGGANGKEPGAQLAINDGYLYGTTEHGGSGARASVVVGRFSGYKSAKVPKG